MQAGLRLHVTGCFYDFTEDFVYLYFFVHYHVFDMSTNLGTEVGKKKK